MHSIVVFWQWFWNWFAIHTGTYNEPGPYYGFWSGFGSDIGEVVLIGSVLTLYKHHNCAVPKCPRLAHNKYEITEIKEATCRHHHTAKWTKLLIKQYKEDYPEQFKHIKNHAQ